MNARVVVTDFTFPSLEPEQNVLSEVGGTVEGHQCKTEDDVIAAVGDAKVVLAQFAPITRRVLEHLGEGATVVRYGVGVDTIDLGAAKEIGIKVAYVPDYCLDEVAEHTTALLLTLLRRIPALDRGVRAGRWDGIALAKPLLPFKETTVGLVGVGRIGSEVVARLSAFGFTFLVYDPYLSQAQADELGVTLTELGELLAEADAITLHIPLTEQTQHFINQERLGQMKPTAVLVNTARGGLVDPDALVAALQAGKLRAAALDVFEEEPLPEDSPLRASENLLLTPHIAWYSERAVERLQQLAAEEAARALLGQPLRCPVEL